MGCVQQVRRGIRSLTMSRLSVRAMMLLCAVHRAGEWWAANVPGAHLLCSERARSAKKERQLLTRRRYATAEAAFVAARASAVAGKPYLVATE
jgi:hypothetical protein